MEQYDELNINRDVIVLSRQNVMYKPNPERYTMDLMAYDADDTEASLLDTFEKMFYDLVTEFVGNHVVLYGAPYKKIKDESKGLFSRKWKPGKYSTTGATSKLKQQLDCENWSDGLYADILDYYVEYSFFSPERYYSKNLYILQEKLDLNLLKKTDMSYEYEGSDDTYVLIYNNSKIKHLEDAEATILHYLKEEKPIIEICAVILLPRIGISLDENYISKEKCIETIKRIVEKYNKILEVKL